MAIEEIRIKGMHCNACEKTITQALTSAGITVESISYAEGKARIRHDGVGRETIATVLNEKGYLLGELSGVEAPLVHRQVMKRTSASRIERDILLNCFLALGLLLVIQALLALGVYPLIPGYETRYFPLFLYLPMAIVTNIAALWHQRAYRRDASRMTGLMISIATGVTAGFSLGAIVGLMNGIFAGSMVGALSGIAAGVYAGRCCGAIGTVGGVMAGLLSGTTGAMLAVIMAADHIEIFLPFLIAGCIVILAGLVRAVMEESGSDAHDAQPWPFTNLFAFSFILVIVISAIMLFAPKGVY